MSEDWKEVVSEQGKFVRWNEESRNPTEGEKTVYVGPVVQGVYVKRNEHVGENDSTVYVIDTEEHGTLSVWATTVLADKMSEVPVGNEVRIENTGSQKPKNGGKAYQLFSVQTRQLPMSEVSGSEEFQEELIDDDGLPPM